MKQLFAKGEKTSSIYHSLVLVSFITKLLKTFGVTFH